MSVMLRETELSGEVNERFCSDISRIGGDGCYLAAWAEQSAKKIRNASTSVRVAGINPLAQSDADFKLFLLLLPGLENRLQTNWEDKQPDKARELYRQMRTWGRPDLIWTGAPRAGSILLKIFMEAGRLDEACEILDECLPPLPDRPCNNWSGDLRPIGAEADPGLFDTNMAESIRELAFSLLKDGRPLQALLVWEKTNRLRSLPAVLATWLATLSDIIRSLCSGEVAPEAEVVEKLFAAYMLALRHAGYNIPQRPTVAVLLSWACLYRGLVENAGAIYRDLEDYNEGGEHERARVQVGAWLCVADAEMNNMNWAYVLAMLLPGPWDEWCGDQPGCLSNPEGLPWGRDSFIAAVEPDRPPLNQANSYLEQVYLRALRALYLGACRNNNPEQAGDVRELALMALESLAAAPELHGECAEFFRTSGMEPVEEPLETRLTQNEPCEPEPAGPARPDDEPESGAPSDLPPPEESAPLSLLRRRLDECLQRPENQAEELDRRQLAALADDFMTLHEELRRDSPQSEQTAAALSGGIACQAAAGLFREALANYRDLLAEAGLVELAELSGQAERATSSYNADTRGRPAALFIEPGSLSEELQKALGSAGLALVDGLLGALRNPQARVIYEAMPIMEAEDSLTNLYKARAGRSLIRSLRRFGEFLQVGRVFAELSQLGDSPEIRQVREEAQRLL